MYRVYSGDVSDASEHDNGLEVFDLYCGCGGFSEGAAEAGCRVVFACDSYELPIETHRLNHPLAEHWCEELPRADLPFPLDGRRLRWATPGGKAGFVLMNPSEMARLQCFPEDYVLHRKTRVAMRLIGNALPPTVMTQMLSAD